MKTRAKARARDALLMIDGIVSEDPIPIPPDTIGRWPALWRPGAVQGQWVAMIGGAWYTARRFMWRGSAFNPIWHLQSIDGTIIVGWDGSISKEESA